MTERTRDPNTWGPLALSALALALTTVGAVLGLLALFVKLRWLVAPGWGLELTALGAAVKAVLRPASGRGGVARRLGLVPLVVVSLGLSAILGLGTVGLVFGSDIEHMFPEAEPLTAPRPALDPPRSK